MAELNVPDYLKALKDWMDSKPGYSQEGAAVERLLEFSSVLLDFQNETGNTLKPTGMLPIKIDVNGVPLTISLDENDPATIQTLLVFFSYFFALSG